MTSKKKQKIKIKIIFYFLFLFLFLFFSSLGLNPADVRGVKPWEPPF
jgi:hypothetical protein